MKLRVCHYCNRKIQLAHTFFYQDLEVCIKCFDTKVPRDLSSDRSRTQDELTAWKRYTLPIAPTRDERDGKKESY